MTTTKNETTKTTPTTTSAVPYGMVLAMTGATTPITGVAVDAMRKANTSKSKSVSATPDPVNPSHYDGDACMRAIEQDGDGLAFCLATAKKYLWRVGLKHNRVHEDLGKARWYLDRARDQPQRTGRELSEVHAQRVDYLEDLLDLLELAVQGGDLPDMRPHLVQGVEDLHYPYVRNVGMYGKEHWTLLLYLETVIVDNRGIPDPRRMNERDMDLANEMVDDHLVVWSGTGLQPIFSFTDLGWAVAHAVRRERSWWDGSASEPRWSRSESDESDDQSHEPLGFVDRARMAAEAAIREILPPTSTPA